MSRPERIEALLSHSAWIDRLAHTLVRDPAEADEVVQEAWVRALENPPGEEGNLRGWMARVVRRVIARRHRSALRRGDHESRGDAPRGPKTPDQIASDVALQRELTDAVLALPAGQRDVMLLRYFEDLPPRKIAARLDIPVNTVRSRLQRGAAGLRTQLDETHGDRRRWVLALLPLASRAFLSETALSAAGLGVAGTVGAAVIVGGSLVIIRGAEAPRPEVPGAGTSTAVASVDGDGDETDPELVPVNGPGVRDEVEPVAAPDETEAADAPGGIAGLVLDLDGLPAPHVRMRRQSENAVRWQGGDRGWISGGGGARRITAADEARAREDGAFARQLLRGLKHQDEWRATLLDAPLPGRDERADLEGRFRFELDGPVSAGSIEVQDPDWAELARGEVPVPGAEDASRHAWIVARAHRIEGEVRGSDGAVPERGEVRLVHDLGATLRSLPFEFTGTPSFRTLATNLDEGTFLVRSAPIAAGCMLEISAPGYRTRRLEIPRTLPDPFVVTLDPVAEESRWRVRAEVVDAAGQPVSGALVALGAERGTTDASGRIELVTDEVKAGDDLVAVAAGRGATLRRDFGEGLVSGAAPDSVTLVLDDAQGTVSGVAPAAAGWKVELDDPTMPAFSFSSIEQRAAGRGAPVTVAADGSFAIDGVFDRTYALRFWRPGTSAVHLVEGVRPGTPVSVDVTSGLRSVSATLTMEGAGGARVTVQHRTVANFDGGGGLFEGGPMVQAGADGTFTLPQVPRRGAFLVVIPAGGGGQVLVPVEDLPDEGAEIGQPAECLVEVRCDFLKEPHTLSFESAAGTPLRFRTVGSGAATVDLATSALGRFPVALVPPGARVAVVVAPDGEHRQVELVPSLEGPVSVRLR